MEDAQNKDKCTSVDAPVRPESRRPEGTVGQLDHQELTKSTLFELDKFPAFSPRCKAAALLARSGGGCLRGQSLISGSPTASFTFTSEAHESGQGGVIKKNNSGFGRRGEQVRGRLVSDGSWDKAYARR